VEDRISSGGSGLEPGVASPCLSPRRRPRRATQCAGASIGACFLLQEPADCFDEPLDLVVVGGPHRGSPGGECGKGRVGGRPPRLAIRFRAASGDSSRLQQPRDR